MSRACVIPFALENQEWDLPFVVFYTNEKVSNYILYENENDKSATAVRAFASRAKD